jgi:pyruvate dehydrogenase E2 component (dihydrolipoamide acetyltransferase)
MSDVVMPRLSDSMEEGTILRWLKADGEQVERGEEIVEIETDKANMPYEAEVAGTLAIVAAEGSAVAVGAVIARIGDGGEASGEAAPAQAAPPAAPARAAAAAETSAPRAAADRVKASPVARRLAEQLGVDLAAVAGSGPGGRIVKGDVEAAAAPAPPAPAAAAPAQAAAPAGAAANGAQGRGAVQTVELSKLQQTIARRMAESKATAPEFAISTVVDMAPAVALRAQLKALAGDAPAPSFNDMVVKAAALALREFPRANGAYRDGAFALHERVNVGIAVAAQDALVVPTVFDADRRPLAEIATEARALAGKVRDGSITPPQLSGGTFTVSNLGMFGVTEFTAILNQGQAGILAVGALQDVPVVEDGAIVPGKRLALTLTCDHRILYGADAAEFLARVRALLEAPIALVA